MSSPRQSLLILDAVPKRGLLRSKRTGNDTIAHLRKHMVTLRSMAGVIGTDVTQRLPSTKSLDKRWDRSRSALLRNAQRNVLRDFRWTLDDPVTFAEPPSSSREYATKRPIGGKPQATSTGNRAAQSDLMDNTHAILGVDSTFNLRTALKEKDAKIRKLEELIDLLLKKQDKGFEDQRATLSAREASVKESENRVEKDKTRMKEQERDLSSREKSLKSMVADERAKAFRDAQDAVSVEQRALQTGWEDLRQAKEREDAALKRKRSDLKRREDSIDLVETESRANARLAEEEAYDAKHQDLDELRKIIETDLADVERNKARFAVILAKATEAAKRDVVTQYEGLIESALQKESDAVEKRNEAARLREDVVKIKQEAIRSATEIEQEAAQNAQSVWQSHEEAANHIQKEHSQTHTAHKEILRKERALELTKFQKNLPNAQYREQVERQDYDSYQKIWDKLLQRATTYRRNVDTVHALQREQAVQWRDLAKRFDKAKIHQSLPVQYRAICERIKEHLHSSQKRADFAAGRTEQDRAILVMGVLRSMQLQGHYSRVLSRFHRFGGYHGKAGMAEVMNLVFREGPLETLREELQLRKVKIGILLQNGVSSSESAHLQAELVGLESGIAKLGDEIRALSLWRRLEKLQVLRHDSIHEKEIAVTTEDAKAWLNQATRIFTDFQNDNVGVVAHSEVHEDVQRRERDEISRRLRGARKDFEEYQTFIRERSVLAHQLGEVEAHKASLDADIDREIETLTPRVLKSARTIVGLPSPSSSRGRPLAFRANLRSVEPVKPRALVRSFPSGGPVMAVTRRTVRSGPASTAPIPKEPEQVQRSLKEVNSMIAKLAQRLRDKSTYNNEQERAKDKTEFDRLKLSKMTLELQSLKSSKSALLENGDVDQAKSERLDENIKGLERRLAGASSRESRTKAQRPSRAERLRRSTKALRKKDLQKSVAANANKVAVAPSLNLKPTASQQACYPLWPNGLRNLHANDMKTEWHGTNMLPRILSKRVEHEHFTLPALRVYSLHSLHIPAMNGPNASDSFSTSPNSHPLDSSFSLTQSSAEAISDPESDDPYDPSESDDAASIPEMADSMADTLDLQISSSLPSTQEFADAVEQQPLAPTIPGAVMNEQVDSQMTYKISVEDYRRAAMASQSTNTAFWSYKLYKNAEGKTPSIHYCTNFETAEAQAKQFIDEKVLGFDLEWEFGSAPGKSSIKNAVSLVQIASESRIGLFQLAMFKGDKPEQLMPPSLRQILQSRDIAKTGVNISGDATRIEKCFGFAMQGIFEVSHLYKVVTWSQTAPGLVNKKPVKLADQVQNVLLLPLKKDSVRVSAWSRRLRPEQTEYAASDAYAGLRLYHALEARRKTIRPTPERPAFYEDRQPLRLPDGTVVVPRKVPKKKRVDTGKAVEEDEDDDEEFEEYFDALETLDPDQLDSTAGVPLAGLSISYPTLPTMEDNINESEQSTQDVQAAVPSGESATPARSSTEPSKAPSKPRPALPSSPPVTAADSWAQTFRNSLPATHNLKSKHAILRAYHLWHHQSLECKEVAALLRDPPLSVMTVASYVLQAVSEESELECNRDRVVATLEILPASARGRYYRVVERVERAEVEREVARGFG